MPLNCLLVDDSEVFLASAARLLEAAPGTGSGLIGLVDRVEALGGALSIDSPAGQGTTLSIELPLTSARAI